MQRKKERKVETDIAILLLYRIPCDVRVDLTYAYAIYVFFRHIFLMNEFIPN